MRDAGSKLITWAVALLLIAGGAYFFRAELASLLSRRTPSKAPLPRREITPPPLPTPTAAVAVTPPASQPAEPEPKPEVATPAAPAPDPLAWLLAHKDRWPEEVVLLEPAVFPAVVNRKVFGSAKVPVGTEVQLVEVSADKVAVVYQGGGARVPVKATNVRELAEIEMNSTAPAPEAVPAVGSVAAPVQRQVAEPSAQRPKRKPGPFIHPGLLHTEADFDRMRKEVKAEKKPWIDGYNLLTRDHHAQLNYGPRPVGTILRGGRGENFPLLFNDIHATYQLALRWKISGDNKFADKSINVINAWSGTLKSMQGNSDRFLGVGIYGYQFANAGEIMRTYPGWKKEDFNRFQDLMLNVIYPMNKDFLIRHNNAAITNYWANWDLCNIASIQAIGVLCDREDIYNEAMDYFRNGKGNGALDKAIYYVHDGYLGQWQEAGRDQGHTTLGIALMGPIMETAWNQGEDWYGYDNNLFLAGAEYVAKYNLQSDVPFQLYAFGTGQKGQLQVQPGVSPAARGHVRAGFELVINHYRSRRGIDAPWSEKYVGRLRPEGGPAGHASTFDQLGMGTLTHTRDPEVANPTPSGLTVQKRAGKPVLSWWGAAGADSYHVQRAINAGGPYATIAKDLKDLLTYTDEAATSGSYSYVITGMRGGQETGPSNAVSFSAAPILRTHLKFDESSGNTATNAADKKNPGTVTKGNWGAGRNSNAVSLNGKDGYVSLPGGILSDLSDFTIAAWVNLDSAAPWTRIFDFGDDRGQYMFLTPNCGNGTPRFEVTTVFGYNAQRINSATQFPTKRWVHVAVTLSGRRGKIYIDGAEAGSLDGIDFPPFRLRNTPNNWIGRSQFAPDPYLNGKVDDFRIYDGALTAKEVAALTKPGGPP